MPKQPKVSVRLTPSHERAAVAAALAVYGPNNPQGVFGIAAGPKRVRGRRTSVPTLLLFVPHKLDQPPSPIAPVSFKYRGAHHVVMPDVVATGESARMSANGMPKYSGLHAGAGILAESSKLVAGAVTCLLGPASGPTHLLTAGHLFAPGASNAKVKAARDSGSPTVVVGRLERSLLDDPGAGEPLDAALVKLTAEGQSMARQTGTGARLPRLANAPLDSANIESVWLKAFLPTMGDYVARLEGSFSASAYYANSPFGQTETLRDVITTGSAHNVEGDSGTVLMTQQGDPRPLAAGVVVARAGTLSLHVPLDFVFSKLRADFGPGLRVWSH